MIAPLSWFAVQPHVLIAMHAIFFENKRGAFMLYGEMRIEENKKREKRGLFVSSLYNEVHHD